ALIREAVDARAQTVPVAQRRRAFDAIRALAGGRYLAPSALERIVDEEREAPGDRMLEYPQSPGPFAIIEASDRVHRRQ
ncbi:MAG: hypothetical protein ACYDAR_20270, partial [Thermomicrobiales bacterium]